MGKGPIVTLFTVFLLFGCLAETEFQPNVPQPIYPTIRDQQVDFGYWISRTDEGVVYFENRSYWMQEYHWDFGFTKKDGNRATSPLKNPSYLFPANGQYQIKLTAIDTTGIAHERIRILDLDNYN